MVRLKPVERRLGSIKHHRSKSNHNANAPYHSLARHVEKYLFRISTGSSVERGVGADIASVSGLRARSVLVTSRGVSSSGGEDWYWVTVRKAMELVSASVSVIAVAKKETVRTPTVV